MFICGIIAVIICIGYRLINPPPVTITGGSFSSYCFPKDNTFNLQPQQKFVAKYMDPARKHKSLLLVHKIGSGKTCSAIQIANKYVDSPKSKVRARPLILMPASLIAGFYNEARSPCSGLVTKDQIKELSVIPNNTSLKKRLDNIIDNVYNIMSYNRFFTHPPRSASCIIIDEVQNVDNVNGNIFKKLVHWVDNHDIPVILLTATPIFDSPNELAGIARLMKLDYTEITPATIPTIFAGSVSYYTGAPAYTYPEITIKIKKCLMSQHQSSWYKKQVEAEMKNGSIQLVTTTDSFYIKSRQKANVVYPSGLTTSKFTRSHIDKLEVYSAKVAALIKQLKKNKLAFIYTSFTGAYGIEFITTVLNALGYKSFKENKGGKRTYAVWSGNQSIKEKDNIRETFNSEANDDGSLLQIIIGSPAIKEGVSLFRCRQVHILETYWNHSRLEQIYGRAVRYCSHKRLPKEDRNVTIYIYCAIVSTSDPTPENSIDLYMLQIADNKRTQNKPYLDALISSAVDKNKY